MGLYVVCGGYPSTPAALSLRFNNTYLVRKNAIIKEINELYILKNIYQQKE